MLGYYLQGFRVLFAKGLGFEVFFVNFRAHSIPPQGMRDVSWGIWSRMQHLDFKGLLLQGIRGSWVVPPRVVPLSVFPQYGLNVALLWANVVP